MPTPAAAATPTTPAAATVLGPDEGTPYWFLNTLTLNKVTARSTHGALSVVDHRVPAGFGPPPHVHHGVDEAFYLIDGHITGFCGEEQFEAGPGVMVLLPRDVPHGFQVSADGPARALVMVAPGGFDEFVAALGEPAGALTLPEPSEPDVAKVIALAAAHGIHILPPPGP